MSDHRGRISNLMADATPNTGSKPARPGQPPAAGSGKRKRQRKYGVDMSILKCPICLVPFSPPVYQCQNGHTVCSACCNEDVVGRSCSTCSLPTGSIRCIVVEQLLESLMVCCKYAPNGCDQKLKQTEIRTHEEDECNYKPFHCLFKDCNYKASKVTLPVHLAEEHEVPTVAYNSISGAGFKMESLDYVIVKCDQETDPLFIFQREKMIPLGEFFSCHSLGASRFKRYDIKVKLCSSPSLSYSMVGARAINLLDRRKRSSLEVTDLILPFCRSDAQGMAANRPVEVLFRLFS